MNVLPKGKCNYYGGVPQELLEAYSKEDQASCDALDSSTAGTVKWEEYVHNTPPPECKTADWSRVNHLGNGRDGKPVTYKWKIPEMNQLGQYTETNNGQIAKCVLRLRYNISTDDYDPRNTDSRHNAEPETGKESPVQQNPTVDIGADLQGLRLAINTAQFGRTFQDRSHAFYIKPPPSGIRGEDIINLNVRGKRGNIVQTFPAVEYDFVPNDVTIQPGKYLHFQWTGSNTHNNGNPAGDGQAGDAGEGTGGTDRSSVVCTAGSDLNFPIAIDKPEHQNKCLFTNQNFECYKPVIEGAAWWNYNQTTALDAVDCALHMATVGYYQNSNDVGEKPPHNPLNNNAPASLVREFPRNILAEPIIAIQKNQITFTDLDFSIVIGWRNVSQSEKYRDLPLHVDSEQQLLEQVCFIILCFPFFFLLFLFTFHNH